MSTTLSNRGQVRRDAVLEIARDLLVEEGFDQFVLRRVAAKADMKLGNLQYYFATRDDLLEAVIRAEFDRDLDALRRATTVESAEGLKTAARALVRNWTTGAGSVFGTMSLLAYHHDRFRELNREIYATFYRELSVLIRQVSPGVPKAEAAARARLVTAVLDGVAMQIHAGVIGKRELTSRAADLVVTIAQGRPG
ncbi:TetR family transcriptional regulator [Kribbella antiqua]|uniref:TetR family transcriptional regulator n=1 Tax=Kribbella antiqua TaxID=2512217 RepID=A0A4R2IA33_9ACTN|nr:TetR/AcrR family transcriptional regulator [Kribbella antiqua]TCO40519.1 TetR family transcriptional regulator [Kribbella antiqua]